MNPRKTLGLGLLLISPLCMAATCQPAPVPDPPSEVAATGTPLPQSSTIPIQAWSGGKWVTVHASQSGMELLSSLWCLYDGVINSDTHVCSLQDPVMYNGMLTPSGISNSGLTRDKTCGAALCRQRTELCAGYMLEELARSPRPKVLDPAAEAEKPSPIEAGPVWESFQINLATLGLPAEEVREFRDSNPDTGRLPVTTKVRLQPLEAAGRAAALRGALNRYAASTRWAEASRSTKLEGQPCVLWLGAWDVANVQAQGGTPALGPGGTGFQPGPDDRVPTWSDVFYESFVDAATQYSKILPDVVEATRAAAQTELNGKAALADEIATQWDGKVDSARGAARLLAYGDENTPDPPQLPKTMAAGDCTGESPAQDIGPAHVPVCPPVANDKGTHRAIVAMRMLKLAPTTGDPLMGVVKSYNVQFQEANNEPDLPSDQVLDQLGFDQNALKAANTYLCQQKKAFGTVLSVDKSASGLAPPTYYGTGQPSSALPPSALSAHFLGASADESVVDSNNQRAFGGPSSDAYTGGGAMRMLDSIKFTASNLANLPHGTPPGQSAPVLDPKVNDSLDGLLKGLQNDTGQERLEFLIASDALGAITRVVIRVHGVASQNGLTNEQYWAVQGDAALKCVTEGSIDGAPCNPEDYLWDVNANGTLGPLDPRMTDLQGGTLEASISAVDMPGGTTPIDPSKALYIVRNSSTGRVAYGGVVPFGGAVPLKLPGYPDVTRQVMAPTGGSYDQVLANSLEPNSDDCSKGLTSCAGLPIDFWPPLESEVNGQPTAQPFEQSWAHYLQLAKDAAKAADTLGEQVIEQGLKMDVRREEAKDKLLDLCGPDGDQQVGCLPAKDGTPADIAADTWVSLGKHQSCIWKYNDELCGCKDNDTCPECPLPVPDGTLIKTIADSQTNRGRCRDKTTLLDADYTMIPVAFWLGLSKNATDGPRSQSCTPFSQLRYGDVKTTDKNETLAQRREEVIRTQIMPNWSQPAVTNIAEAMRYSEHFADNYELTYNQQPFFDTRRQGRRSQSFIPPCATDQLDRDSGSRFWSMPIRCAPDTDCDHPPEGQGADGCTTSEPSQWSLDTEPEALRTRWAWGFGHLRRSVATLGVLTGALSNGLMKLAKVAFVAGSATSSTGPNGNLVPGPSGDRGSPCTPPTKNNNEPNWVRHCPQGGKTSRRDRTRCVWPLGGFEADGGEPGVDFGGSTDTYRQFSGRPVNWNGFIPPTYPKFQYLIAGAPSHVLAGFPQLCSGTGSCAPIGVDPQMVYCNIPDPDSLQNASTYSDWTGPPQDIWSVQTGTVGGIPVTEDKSTGYVGASITLQPNMRAMNSTWSHAIDAMWKLPGPDEHFCDKDFGKDLHPSYKYAVWRALCTVVSLTPDPKDPAPATKPEQEFAQLRSNPDFRTLGKVNDKAPLVTGQEVATWLTPEPNKTYEFTQYLFDLRPRNGSTPAVTNNPPSVPPFQYPLTARNIFDALELACHVDALQTAPKDCGNLDVKNISGSYDSQLDQLSGALDCIAAKTDNAVARYAFGPTSEELIQSFAQGEALSSTSNTGGQYRQDLSKQYDALTRIERDYRHIADATRDLAFASHAMSLIKAKQGAQEEQTHLETAAHIVRGLADLANTAADIASEPVSAHGGDALKALAAGLNWQATGLEVGALQAQLQASTADNDLQLLEQIRSVSQDVTNASDASDDLLDALNELGDASSDLALVRKKAELALARIDFADYAGATGEDPQYVNVANRRIYNTKLIRYERALHRAKQLAFVARRAIELRFGVDFDNMQRDMTLVEAPAKWGNDVCTMQGIDYSKIRSPNPRQPVSGYDFGDTPIPGDEFANDYIGDYVDKLQDFVNSYPIDYPLKDGDDVAVVSLADDIYGVNARCSEPGRNLLYYSTQFDNNDDPTDVKSGRGWYVDGCTETMPDGSLWDGCVEVAPIHESVHDPTGVLPAGAVAYRMTNAKCIPASVAPGEPDGCPVDQAYPAEGTLVQDLGTLQVGYYAMSLYVHADGSRPGSGAYMQVVSDTASGAQGAQVSLAPTAGWQRIQKRFTVTTPGHYRLRLSPSGGGLPQAPSSGGSTQTLLGDGPVWPGLLITAAQVEQVFEQADGSPTTADVWVRTDASRNHMVPNCTAARGAALRKRFVRKCDYVCKTGVQEQPCSNDDPSAVPERCYYEANFDIDLSRIEDGSLIPSGQIAIGNFNFRHNKVGVNFVGTGVTDCSTSSAPSCYENGFVEYTLVHSGNTRIRSWDGASIPAHMQRAFIQHGKGLAAERVITNPPSSTDLGLMTPYMKSELKGRPMQGLYTLRIWDQPGLRWDQLDDIQLVWDYHYWTRFEQ